MTIDPTELARLKALAEAATPGPWKQDDGNVFSVPLGKPRADALMKRWSASPPIDVEIPEENGFLFGGQENDNYDANADFVVAANPQVVLSLIAEVERLQAAVSAGPVQVIAMGRKGEP